MRRDFLGDSFDIVKRFWAERLASIAPLFAHPTFVPMAIKSQFEKTVGIPFLDERQHPEPFGLFLDPDTGIPLPTAPMRKATRSHAPVHFIIQEIERLKPKYLVCFDQSHDRHCGQSKAKQRQTKLFALRDRGIAPMYYVSHAPFLFAARETADLRAIRDRLVESGIPERRFEDGSEGAG
jgi:hypothetical protein